MNTTRLIGIVMLAAGLLALAYGGFSYTQEETALQLGSVQLQVEQKKRVNVPLWAGVGLAVAGGLLRRAPSAADRSAGARAPPRRASRSPGHGR